MKLVSFERNGAAGWGAVVDTGIVDMSRRLGGRYPSLKSALAAGALAEVASELESVKPDFALDAVKLEPPIPDPAKVICIGLNYRAHIVRAAASFPNSLPLHPLRRHARGSQRADHPAAGFERARLRM